MAKNSGTGRRATSARTNALSPLTRTILWAKAAGHCQYAGCNKCNRCEHPTSHGGLIYWTVCP